MAPPPEYDKEPKAPDKSATVLPGDDSKALHNLFIDHQNNSDSKTANATANVEVENNKHVEHLDDGQLKALLDEAITYKRPKDREGKSSLFNELLEEVEQDEQALEAAARELSGGRTARRVPRAGRRALAHSNSLQDLEQEALAAECALRRVRPAPASVSARALHGGSLPCDVDKSFLLGEESSGRGGYLATVRCVNPPPLGERRVSASDAHDHEPGAGARRSKPAFPMTYTARATLEIGSGSVGSGRAVTTTTASNQVRTPPPRPPRTPRPPARRAATRWTPLTTGPPARLYSERLYDPYHEPDYYLYKKREVSHSDAGKPENLNESSKFQQIGTPKIILPTVKEEKDSNQSKLLKALLPKTNCGGGNEESNSEDVSSNDREKKPRGPRKKKNRNTGKINVQNQSSAIETNAVNKIESNFWINKVNTWYEGLGTYSSQDRPTAETLTLYKTNITNVFPPDKNFRNDFSYLPLECDASGVKPNNRALKSLELPSTSDGDLIFPYKAKCDMQKKTKQGKVIKELIKEDTHNNCNQHCAKYEKYLDFSVEVEQNDEDRSLIHSQLKYRERVGSLTAPKVTCCNPKNVRGMTIGRPSAFEGFERNSEASKEVTDDKKNWLTQKCNKNQSDFVNQSSNKNKDGLFIGSYTQPIKNQVTEEHNENKEGNLKVSRANLNKHKSINVSMCKEIQKYIPSASTIVKEESLKNSKECSNKNATRHKKTLDLEKKYLQMSKSHKTDLTTNTEFFAVNLELKGLSDLYLPEIVEKSELMLEIMSERNTQDITVLDHNITYLDIPKVQKNNSCSNIENKTVNKLISKEKSNDNLGIKSERNTQDTTVQNSNESFDESKIETILNKNKEEDNEIELTDMIFSSKLYIDEEEGVELIEIKSKNHNKMKASFSKYLDDQQKLFQSLEDKNNYLQYTDSKNSEENQIFTITKDGHELQPAEPDDVPSDDNGSKLQLVKKEDSSNYVLGVVPNNAYVFLTFPKSLQLPFPKSLHEVETDTAPAANISSKSRKKKSKAASASTGSNKSVLSREELKALLLQNLMKSESDDKSVRLKGTRATAGRQVDSAIPFNCITSSEVVDTCNTTTSTQPSVAEDTKPLQLGWGYRAVASLTGAPAAAPRAPRAPRPPRAPAAGRGPAAAPQPRSVISSSFNGLPLARTSYGSTATTSSSDEYKKSLDENGNSLQGFSSPQSGSSHNKKPRRKKSSKNETVITSHQIDGYKGDKDLNEVLRFIESRAEQGRARKLGRSKHKDDADDKAGKKRSAERRKDKEPKVKRASSLEELSRTSLRDLTDEPLEPHEPPAPPRRAAPAKPAKPERRSWGDDARDAFYFRDDAPIDTPPDADFQTVTKKRKPRRRADEPEPEPPEPPEPPRPPRAPTPRARRVSAPPSDRSADSNDDMDSVHSLPADAPRLSAPAPAPISYADIARTRHNIPDLIESCNFYAEGGVSGAGEAGEAGEAAAGEARARGDADGYPALEPRHAPRRPRDLRDLPAKPPSAPVPATATLIRDRKETRVAEAEAGAGAEAGAAAGPAPDVVADRRPAVILLDSAARPGDMDGVTFGFDINEQLLGGSTRRPRCDLVRDAVESEPAPAEEPPPAPPAPPARPTAEGAGKAGAGVAVAAGCGALRWLPPRPPHDAHQLLQIVDFVGAAWEDVVRCGGGKVRYFSE